MCCGNVSSQSITQQSQNQNATQVASKKTQTPEQIQAIPEYVKNTKDPQLIVTYDNKDKTIMLEVAINGMRAGDGEGQYNPAWFGFTFLPLSGKIEEIQATTYSRTYPALPHHTIKITVVRLTDNMQVFTGVYTIPRM